MTDRFDKTPNSPASTPGWADGAHKDGYNVVYGDFHSKWYADKESRLLYWDPPRKASIMSANMATSTAYDPLLTQTADPAAWYDNRNQAMLAWHLFDENAGVDVGAPAD